jgi:hypothetical protein
MEVGFGGAPKPWEGKACYRMTTSDRVRRISRFGAPAAAMLLILATAGAALADGIVGDVDADALTSPFANGTTAQQAAGSCVDYDFSAGVHDTGGQTAVFPVSVSVAINLAPPDWTVSLSTSSLSVPGYATAVGGQVHICTTSGTPSGQVKVLLTTDQSLAPDSVPLNYNISAPVASCSPDWQVGQFFQPLDASYTDGTETNVTVNKMKAGRVVPVKLTIWDACTQAYLTDPTASVLINVFASNANGVDSTDAVESYADAGASSGNTRNFRWTVDATAPGGGFWIYNLDSRTVINGGAMVVGTTYRVDVWAGAIGGDKVTTNDWAYLAATK